MSKTRIRRKALSILLSVCMVVSLFTANPVGVRAAGNDADRTVLYLDSGNIIIADSGYSVDGGDAAQTSGRFLITQKYSSTQQHRISVESGTADIVLRNVNIDVSGTGNSCAFPIAAGAAVNLTLEGTNTLKSEHYCAGLQVRRDEDNPAKNAALTITAQSTGSLTANGGGLGAGIGGGFQSAGGTITINGGTVTATGGNDGAGIGGGADGAGGTITINGGTVTATGGDSAAGIGGGKQGAGGTITINGGTVTATCGNYAAGIGGGSRGAGGTVKINGGTVSAVGGLYGAGIGGGDQGAGGTITINGGTVTAVGGYEGAGIGGGSEGAGGTVTITGKGTQVVATGVDGGKDIGSGSKGTGGGNLLVGDSNSEEPLPSVSMRLEGTDSANPDSSRSQFINCTIYGAGAKNGLGSNISGSYDANGKIKLFVGIAPGSGKVGSPVTLTAQVKRCLINDIITPPGTVSFTVNGVSIGTSVSIAANGTAQINWTPTDNIEYLLKATYVPVSGDRYTSTPSLGASYYASTTMPIIKTFPAASQITYGSKLSSCALTGCSAVNASGAAIPGTFAWENPDTAITVSGYCNTVFTPNNTAIYNTVLFQVPVTVKAASSSTSSSFPPSIPASLTNTGTGAQIDLSGASFPAWVTGVTLSAAQPQTAGGSSDMQAANVFRIATTKASLNVIGTPYVYNIKLLDQNGNEITQFTGKMKVKVPIPAGIHGTPHVFRYEETGALTDMNAVTENGFLVFETDHFSYYAIAGTGDSVTLDTMRYQMPINGGYQIGAKLTGSKASSVKFYSTNDKIATVTKLKNGNYQVFGKGTGTVYIMFDVFDSKHRFLTHASVRVDVKTGIRPKGDSTRQIGTF